MFARFIAIDVGVILIQLASGYALEHPRDSWSILVSRKRDAKRYWSSLSFQSI